MIVKTAIGDYINLATACFITLRTHSAEHHVEVSYPGQGALKMTLGHYTELARAEGMRNAIGDAWVRGEASFDMTSDPAASAERSQGRRGERGTAPRVACLRPRDGTAGIE